MPASMLAFLVTLDKPIIIIIIIQIYIVHTDDTSRL